MATRKVSTPTRLGILLHTYRSLTYSWKHAIGEMVDNSVDSYLENKDQLPDGLDIWITYDGPGRKLTVKDNAFGMNAIDIDAAVQITRQSKDKKYFESGIGKYGLGLKKSATSLGDKWKVVTTAKGSDTKFTVDIDVMKLFHNNSSEVLVKESKAAQKTHETRIEINLRKVMKGRAERSVRKSLAEMYRFYIDNGEIRIHWNEKLLEYDNPEVRQTSTANDDDKKQIWWSSIELPITVKKKKVATVTGEIYLLATMSNTDSGIQLFHSKRMFEGGSGSPNLNWRPAELVGGLENYRARRFCAALHLDMLEANHQKDGFAWDLFDREDLLKALKKSKLVKSYLKEAKKKKGGETKTGPNPKVTAKNIRGRLDSQSVQNTINKESATRNQKARQLSRDMVEEMVNDSGIILEAGKEPIATISFVEQIHGPVLTNLVTGQKNGHDLLRILINQSHEYYDLAVNTEEEQELWIEFMHAIALTEHTLSDVDGLDFEKIISTMGNFLSSFRSSDK